MAERIEKGQMEPELYTSILDQLVENNFKGRISYDFYNEPLLCKNLSLFTAQTKERLPESEIHLYSNGSLLSLERFIELESIGITHFIITKHEDHDDDKKAYLFDKTYRDLTEQQKSKVLYRSHQKLALTNRGGTLTHITSTVADIKNYPCFIPTFMMTITVNGTVLPCFEDFHQQHAMGNLKEKSLKEIWMQPEYIKMRKALIMGQRGLFKACMNCTRVNVMPDGNKASRLRK